MSADTDEEDFSAIAWPGFVDILSSVIIMFVFFMLIIAAVLYFYMIVYISKIESDEAVIDSDYDKQLKQSQSEFAESEEQKSTYNEDERIITVFFGEDAITVIPETIDTITKIIADYSPEEYIVHVISPKPESTRNITQRKVSIARMFNIRNTILDAGFGQDLVLPRLEEYKAIDGESSWVQIRIIKNNE